MLRCLQEAWAIREGLPPAIQKKRVWPSSGQMGILVAACELEIGHEEGAHDAIDRQRMRPSLRDALPPDGRTFLVCIGATDSVGHKASKRLIRQDMRHRSD